MVNQDPGTFKAVTPDDFQDDSYGHVTNQCGHLALGLAIASVAAFAGLWWPIPLASAAAYWLIGEYVLQRAGLFWDGIEDAGFVAAGASFPFTVTGSWLQIGLVAGVGVVLGIGAWRRS
jgi:hypothetical protein